jgi:hypothetical protein
MLCASVLAELEAAVPVEKRILPPSGDAASVATEESTSNESSGQSAPSSTESTISAPSATSAASVGQPRDFSGFADGTTTAYNSVEKWVLAALRKAGKDKTDIVLPSMEPNDALCSQLHSIIAEWHTSRTIARDAGVVDHRLSELEKPPPQECLVKARGWILRYINQARAEKGISMIADDKWGRKLAGVKADARAVNKKTKQLKAESGTLFRHKHDLAPSPEELMAACYVGFSGDQRVHAEVLDSLETGMAFALSFPTGARAGELKKLQLQSIGHEEMRDETSGLSFICLKLTAFETKTRAQHLNQILAHSNPWRCGVGLLGVSLLVRVKMYGAMPFTMQSKADSWKVIGTSTDTLDDRLKAMFRVAGVRRQLHDTLLNTGRHYGTRLLQHAGGSAEGGAARRGHSNGSASFHYTECPLPDLLKTAGNNSAKPFVPAHHQSDLHPFADAVLLILFPELDAEEKALDARQEQIEAMRAIAEKVRTEEQLNDRQRLLRSIRFACRMALCCMAARPRTWKQWAILEDEGTVWQRGDESNHRVVKTIFGGNAEADAEARKAMDALAREVNRFENAEIQARKIAPEQVIQTEIVSGIQQLHEQNRQMHEQRMVAEHGELPPAFRSEVRPSSPPAPTVAAVTTGVRIKHKRESQDDVAHFSSCPDLGLALTYAKEELAPREKTESAKWRIIQREDGREDKSRDKQWRCYRSVAIAVGILMRGGKSYEDAVSAIQERFESFGAKPHTPFLKAINQDIGKMRSSDADVIAREVLGF